MNRRLRSHQRPSKSTAKTKMSSASEQANSATAMASGQHGVSEDSQVLREIRNMNHNLEMKMDKVIGEVTAIKGVVDSIKSDVAALNSRTEEAEQRISQVEDDNVKLNNTVASMKETISKLGERLQYQENYNRRNSVRIKGIPEETEKGSGVVAMIKEMLCSLFKETPDVAETFEIERAHRTPMSQQNKGTPTQRPRHILVKFLRYADREKVRARAREVGSFTWNGSKVEIFPDFSKEVQDKRNKFTEARHICMKKGWRYSLQYPAVFWVTIDGTRHRFEDAEKARRYVSTLHPAEEAE